MLPIRTGAAIARCPAAQRRPTHDHRSRSLTHARTRIATLQAEPPILAQPPERLQQENQASCARRDAAQRAA
jgi:hypothetical protein